METAGERTFVAHWPLSGCVKLPGRLAIKLYAGATRHELGDDGLIVSHTETWSMSVLDVSTAWPAFGAPPTPRVEEHAFVQPPPPRVLLLSGAGLEQKGED